MKNLILISRPVGALVVLLGNILAGPSQGQIERLPVMGQPWPTPPRSATAEKGESLVIGGISYEWEAGPSGVTMEELASLLFREDSFAHLRSHRRDDQASPTLPWRLATLSVGNRISRVGVGFFDEKRGAKGEVLGIQIDVRPTAKEAQARVSPGPSQTLPTAPAKLKYPVDLGDARRYTIYRDRGEELRFSVGRIMVRIDRDRAAFEDRGFIEAVAVGTLYRILQLPALAQVNVRRTLLVGRAYIEGSAMAGDVSVRVQALRALGIKEIRDGYDTILLARGRKLRVTPFAWTMMTGLGRV